MRGEWWELLHSISGGMWGILAIKNGVLLLKEIRVANSLTQLLDKTHSRCSWRGQVKRFCAAQKPQGCTRGKRHSDYPLGSVDYVTNLNYSLFRIGMGRPKWASGSLYMPTAVSLNTKGLICMRRHSCCQILVRSKCMHCIPHVLMASKHPVKS
jgi:hypothetical protein